MQEITKSEMLDIHRTLTQSNLERRLLPKHARRLALKQLEKAISEKEQLIFSSLFADLGRARFESYLLEIAVIKEAIKVAQKSLTSWCKKTVVKTPMAFQPGSSYVLPTPKGVVLIIAPWNYPFQLSFLPLISAIAAGNCAVIKPSELAGHSAEVISDIVHNYLDQNLFRVINGDVETAKNLLELSFDHIFYTGNTEVGSHVMKKAAEHLTPVTLELGGKSPCIIDNSCDLSLAAKRIAWGKCLNAGQTCIAPDYVLIEKSLETKFVTFLKNHLSKMFGDVKHSKNFGRIINLRHFDRLVAYLKNGHIAHGGYSDREMRLIEPTVLTNVKLNDPVMNEEIFGPILPVAAINNLDEAINLVNSKPHPLALYIFSTQKRNVDKILSNTISGSVAINDCVTQAGITDLPFGGVRHSGLGSYHGKHGFLTFSHMRSVHKRANLLDIPIKYAPYSDKKLSLARLLM